MADLSALSDDELKALYAQQSQPRGMRNNNPLNLEASVNWSGMAGNDGRFAKFNSMDDGIAAADRNLQTYAQKHGLKTVNGIIGRWAPPVENDTRNYAQTVASDLGVDPNQELDMNDAEVRSRLIGSMAKVENGQPLPQAQAAGDLSGLSNEDLMAMYAQVAPMQTVGSSKSGGETIEAPVRNAQPQPQQRTSQGLGFLKGVMPVAEKLNAISNPLSFIPGLDNRAAVANAGQGARAYMQGREANGERPGKLGEFAGNVAATAPFGALRLGAAGLGALSGGLLSDAKDAKGMATDVAVGAVAGKVADKAFKGLGSVASNLLSKAPKVMTLPELQQAKTAAYQAVDASGFRFPKVDGKALVADLEKLVQDKGGKTLYPDAHNWAQRIKTLANQKGGLPLTQLEDARGEIYTQLVKSGGKEGNLGGAMRAKIDALISKEAQQNALLKTARDLNTRYAKASVVSRKLESADLQAGRAYTGKNVNNAIRQKLSPLIDPSSAQRLRNATPDEAAALKRAVVGTPGQNMVRSVGTLLDPRGIIGMGLQAGGFAPSGGMSLASIPLGLGSTAMGNRMSQKNVEELLKLIAAGGSKAALKKVPTRASIAAQRALEAARPASGLVGASAAAQARR